VEKVEKVVKVAKPETVKKRLNQNQPGLAYNSP
jgi:hypothetical protein